MAGSVFYRKLLNSCFCACAVKICTKLTYIVVKSPQFYPLHKKSLLLNTMVTAVFRPEVELTLFLRICTKEISKTWWKCIPTEELLCCHRKSVSPKRMARSDFWPEAPK